MQFESIENKIIYVQNTLRQYWSAIRRAEEEAKREEKAKTSRASYAERALQKSTPVEQTSISYGDGELAQKISAYRSSLTGHLTEKDVMHVGGMVLDAMQGIINEARDENALAEAKSNIKTKAEEWHKLNKVFEKRLKAYKKRASADPNEVSELQTMCDNLNALHRAIGAARAAVNEAYTKEQNAAIDTLMSIRPLCGIPDRTIKAELFANPKSKDVPTMLQALNVYPQEFVEGLLRTQKGLEVEAKKARGFFDEARKVICIRRGSDASFGCAIHEFGHALERACPSILALEREFYDRRTAGCKLEKLREITGNSKYTWTEEVRRDSFIEPYMGKDYSGSAYELVSMGFELFFTKPSVLMKDPDYFKFISGILAMVTP